MTVDASGTTGTIEVWVNGFKQDWDPVAEPEKSWPVVTGGTFKVKTSKRTIILTNTSSSTVGVQNTSGNSDAADGPELEVV